MGPLIPLFWTSGDVSSGFQSQSGQATLFTFGEDIYVTHGLRFTSGVTPAYLLAASIATKLISSTYLQQGIGESQTGDLWLHG